MRNVFFSHDYDDAIPVHQVINCHKFFPELEFRDWRAWETTRYKDPARIKKWIDDELEGSTVTVVLIGTETANSYWVGYEIQQTVAKGNGLLGIHLNKVNAFNQFSAPRARGVNPFAKHPPRPPKRSAEDEQIRRIVDAMMAARAAPAPPANHLAAMYAASIPAPSPGNALVEALRNFEPSNGLGLERERSSSPLGGMFDSDASLGLARLGASSPFATGLLGERDDPFSGKWWERPPPARQIPPPPRLTLADETACYCWVDQNGYDNIGDWIEKAARAAGK